jgi:protein tyrosine phosphatase
MSCTGDEKGYISTQGPVENTVGDFWRMVWIHNVSVVVMLTKEIENGQQKSSRYWPMADTPSAKITYFHYEITIKEKETDLVIGEDLIIRKFELKNLKVNQERTIIHYQYTGWPDHGLPPPAHSHHFLHLMNLVDNTIIERGGPICIHCSAGIGRTGTFCTIHINVHIIRQYFEKHLRPPPLSIVSTVLRLRKQRHGMVQTKDQFLFCYQIITEEYVRLWKEYKAKKQTIEIANSILSFSEPTMPSPAASIEPLPTNNNMNLSQSAVEGKSGAMDIDI